MLGYRNGVGGAALGAHKGYSLRGRSAIHTDGRASRIFAPVTAFMAVASLLAGAVSAEVTVVCLGDSLTEGYGVERDQAYPALLEQRLRALGHDDVRVVNAGIGGATTASAVWRLRWHLRTRPDIVIIGLGANDPLVGMTLDQTRANLDASLSAAKRSGARVVLAGIRYPPFLLPAYTIALANLYPELAAKHDVALVPFLLEGVAGNPALNLRDGIHPNPEGYEIVVDNVLAVIEPLLTKRIEPGE